MPGPPITLTATIQDLTGSALGSVANPAKLCIALCGFGAQLPRIVGTSLIGRPGPIYFETTSGTFSVQLWGNDVITPAGTYYAISLIDANGNVVQSGAYQLTGGGTFDLSSLSPIISASQIAAIPQFIFSSNPAVQQCTGTVNGINTVFAFTAGPTSPTIAVFAGGVYQTLLAGDFTLGYAGSNVWNITFTTAPANGPIVVMIFTKVGERTLTAPGTIFVSGATQDQTIYCNFSAPGTFTIPSAATAGAGYELTFIDVSYAAGVNAITLSGSINNGSTYLINSNGGAVTLHSDGTAWRVKSKF